MPRKIKQPSVYMLASGVNGTLYIGVTSSLYERVIVHRRELHEGFSQQYGVHKLVYYEMFDTMELAIAREKRLKKWNRLWKIRLIEEMNPQWGDLFDEVAGLEEGGAGGQSGLEH